MAEDSSLKHFTLAEIVTQEYRELRLPEMSELSDIQFAFQLGIGLSKDRQKLGFRASIEAVKNDEVLIQLRILCGYKFLNRQEFEKGETVVIPRLLATELSLFTFNTCRGVFHAKTEGKDINNKPLALWSMEGVINEDVKMNLAPKTLD